jgi:hypothetical protein
MLQAECSVSGHALELADASASGWAQQIHPNIGGCKIVDRRMAGFEDAIAALCIGDRLSCKNYT